MRLILKSLIVFFSSLLLLQLEVGWYGIGMNSILLILVVASAFGLGYWGLE